MNPEPVNTSVLDSLALPTSLIGNVLSGGFAPVFSAELSNANNVPEPL